MCLKPSNGLIYLLFYLFVVAWGGGGGGLHYPHVDLK